MLTALLIAVAFVAGVAGSWSPCGLSMVDTLAPGACGGRQRVSVVGALAFAVGALGGGVVTFGGLAVLGDALGAGGGAAAAIGVACLMLAAAGDAAGRRIVPQVRRQVPESWRRVLPVPLAAGLYGVLLGLGFTTFVLSFATWGLAAVCLAVGTPATGVLVGLAFGLGRAIPVGVLAPLQDRDAFAGIAAAMGERPIVLRGLRVGRRRWCAAARWRPRLRGARGRRASGGAGTRARAAARRRGATPRRGRARAPRGPSSPSPARDPSAADGLVAWQSGDRRRPAARRRGDRPARHPSRRRRRLRRLPDGRHRRHRRRRHAADRAHDPDPRGERARHLRDPRRLARARRRRPRHHLRARPRRAAETPNITVVAADAPRTLGRPALDGTTVVYDHQSPTVSRIREYDLATAQPGSPCAARRARSCSRRRWSAAGCCSSARPPPPARLARQPRAVLDDADRAPRQGPRARARRPPPGLPPGQAPEEGAAPAGRPDRHALEHRLRRRRRLRDAPAPPLAVAGPSRGSSASGCRRDVLRRQRAGHRHPAACGRSSAFLRAAGSPGCGAPPRTSGRRARAGPRTSGRWRSAPSNACGLNMRTSTATALLVKVDSLVTPPSRLYLAHDEVRMIATAALKVTPPEGEVERRARSRACAAKASARACSTG